MFVLILLLPMIGAVKANDCSSRYYETIRREGPSLPPNEIISSHKLGIIAAEITCYSLCEEESRCVGFNYRTTATNDENCQLTNVTKNRNTAKKGDWTLRHYVQATKIEEEKRKDANGNPGRDCPDLYQKGHTTNGVYSIDPDGKGAFRVRCDMTTSGGGWTIIQRRVDGSVDFYRNWTDYKNGFGDPKGEYWLGLDKIHRLTNVSTKVIRFDLWDTTGNTTYAEYSFFAIAAEDAKYKLSLGIYSGTAGDSFGYQRGMAFTTRDVDNDVDIGRNCAVTYKGAWWHSDCHKSNLNGFYYLGPHKSYADGVNWAGWKGYYYSLKKTEMKLRPSLV